MAWLKLQFLCHLGDSEVGAFAISHPEFPLRIIDLVLVKQSCSSVSVEFDDEAVADFFEAQIERGRLPHTFARIWVHTHPGNSPSPSGVDEETFSRVFGRCDWSVMFILARGGATYCRLRVSATARSIGDDAAPSVSLSAPLPVDVDYRDLRNELTRPVDLSDWHDEYAANVTPRQTRIMTAAYSADDDLLWSADGPAGRAEAEPEALLWPEMELELDAFALDEEFDDEFDDLFDSEGDPYAS